MSKMAIDRWLSTFMQQAVSRADKGSAHHELLTEIDIMMRRGGKRLRPQLCLLSYTGYGGVNKQDVLPVAGALELLHAFLLMHDDIIDRDQRRWGGANITGVYYERYCTSMNKPRALHNAQAQALLAGDLCHNLAIQALLEVSCAPEILVQLQTLFTEVTAQVLQGEIEDVALSLNAQTPSKEQILAMYRRKTASYSFVLPLQAGALLAGAPPAEIKILAEIGQHLGLAYQMHDDLLGIFGAADKTGKPIISDIREGKYTFLISSTFGLANMEESLALRAILGNSKAGIAELTTAQGIIVRCGARSLVESRIVADSQQALAMLGATQLSGPSRQKISEFITSLIGRER